MSPLRRQLLAGAETALAALTAAAVVGLSRVFADESFLLPVLGFALGGHALAVACRRARLGPGTTLLVAAGGLALAAPLAFLAETTTFGIPTGATLDQAGRELSAAWSTFREVKAPAPVEPGFVLASAVAVWVVAFVADTAAFRGGAVVEAAVPGATLFVFGAALGAPGHRLVSTILFLVALLGYWLAQRALSHAASPTWLAADTREGSRAFLRAGAGLAAVAVLAAVLIGPELPGAEAKSVIPWRASDRDGPDSRVTISPLVDIRARIVDQAETEVFTVRSDIRSYWRLTSLETFDGRIWSSKGQYRPAEGRLPSVVVGEEARVRTGVQEFEISGLASIWLPAAFRPVAVDGVEARYDEDSNSLLTELESPSGLSYRVASEVPELTAAELNTVPSVAPREVAEIYTRLPVEFSQSVQSEAGRIVAGATTQYDKAKRLQDHFRGGLFTYSTDVQPGHGENDLEQFLFGHRTGYCEQFAGAYAAMARAVGLPARVAVGFTAGELDDDGRYRVRGLNGHAWPEVFLAGYGWVPFEPTPGRGIPGAEPYTGVPEEQATAVGGAAPTTVPVTTSTTTPADVPGADTTIPGFGDEGAGGEEAELPAGPTWWEQHRGTVLAVALALVLGPLAWAVAVAVAARVRRRRRRASAATAAERVLVSWEEVGEALARIGAERRPYETPAEYAERAAVGTGLDRRSLRGLAGATSAAVWGPGGVADDVADRAAAVAADLERSADGRLDGRGRLRRALDPRPLLPARGQRRDVRVEERVRSR